MSIKKENMPTSLVNSHSDVEGLEAGAENNQTTLNKQKPDKYADKYGKTIFKYFYGLWLKESLVDVTIRTADRDMMAHRFVLGAYSKALLDLFECNEGRMVLLDLRNVSSSDFEEVLQFLYSANVNLTDKNIRGVLLSSYRLKIRTLLRVCWQYLQGLN